MNAGSLYLALIYLHPGQHEALRRYENLAPPSSGVDEVPLERYFTASS